jgi:hypothetical protein
MKSTFRIFSILLIAFALVFSQSCKKDSDDDNGDNNGTTPPVEDVTPPQVGVTSPTAEFSFLSADNTVTISGFANDDVGVTQVTWTSSAGGSGTVSGTTSWTLENATLSNGDNLFTFVAYDAANNADSAKLLVTFNEFFAFNSTLTINPEGMYVNSSTDVFFKIAIPANPNLDPNSVTLLEVGSDGSLVEDLGQMYDDGDLEHGDDIQGDGVYSLLLNFMENTPGAKYFRVRVTTDEMGVPTEAYSEIGNIMAVEEIPQADVTAILNVQQEADDLFQTTMASAGIDEAVTQTMDYLNQSGMVTETGLTTTGEIWIVFEYGLEGMILTGEEGTEGGAAPQESERAATATIPVSNQTRGANGPAMYKSVKDEHTVLDKDVLLYAPNWTQFNSWGTEFLDNVYDIYNDSECPNFNVEYAKNEDADLQVLRNLGNYGTIVIHTHGGLDKGGNVIFLTGDEVDYTFDEILEWILGRVMSIPHQGKSLWAVKPSFISAYNLSYPNSIVYNGSCESAHNNTMANAFLSRGANNYFGFSETVLSVFDRDMANELFPALVTEGKKVGDAFVPNQHDGSTPPAYFVMMGNEETTYASGFVNGDFDEGGLSGWNVVGDGRVISQLGFITPFAGDYMGIISTGLGYTDEMGSLSQNFCVPDDATELLVNWNFLSEEFMEWVGSQYQDYFEISIIDEDGNKNVLFYKTIDDIAGEYSPVLVSPEIVFDQGDVYGTDWQVSTFDISTYAGTAVTLVLASGDVGDSIYDTVILLDEIMLY